MTNRVTVRLDDDASDALAVLAAAGLSTAEAVRLALRQLADAHLGAYEAGLVEVGQRVEVTACTVEPVAVEVAPAA